MQAFRRTPCFAEGDELDKLEMVFDEFGCGFGAEISLKVGFDEFHEFGGAFVVCLLTLGVRLMSLGVRLMSLGVGFEQR